MKKIETSRGKFIVMDVDYNQHCFVRIGLKSTAMYNSRELFDYDESYKLSEITEEEASEIVDNSMMNTLCYENYINEGFKGRTWFNSAIQSLHSLLESQGIEITNNTYIFKVC